MNAAAFCKIDHRVAISSKDIAGTDDVFATKIGHAVGVCVTRMVKDANTIAIKPETFLGRLIGVCGPSALRRSRLLSRGRAHSIKDGLKRNNGCRVSGTGADVAHDVAPGYGAASLRNLLIPPDVIRIVGRIDDEANRFVGEGADRRQDLVAHCGESGINEQHTSVANLDSDVSSSTDQHVDVGLYRQDMNERVGLLTVLLRVRRRKDGANS